MSDAAGFEVVPATSVGDPVRLESLACAVFGARDRPAGWFGRKLTREHVDASLSRVAVARGAAPDDPAAWLGYVLVGTPPSLGSVARTSGTGVLASARRRGIASALLDAAAQATAHSGRDALELVADAAAESFYAARRFVAMRHLVTLLEFGRRTAGSSAVSPSDHDPPATAPVHELDLGSALLPEAWSDTPVSLRHHLRTEHTQLRFTAEGRAALIHGVAIPPAAIPGGSGARDPSYVVDALAACLEALDAGRPTLLAMLDAVSPITGRLQSGGWSPVQRGVLLRRALRG